MPVTPRWSPRCASSRAPSLTDSPLRADGAHAAGWPRKLEVMAYSSVGYQRFRAAAEQVHMDREYATADALYAAVLRRLGPSHPDRPVLAEARREVLSHLR